MTTVPRLARRLVVAPLVLLLEAAVVVSSPVLGLIAALASPWPLRAGSRAARVVAIAADYSLRHLACTAACGGLWVAGGCGRRVRSPRMLRAHYGLLRWFVAGVHRTMTRLTRIGVRTTADSADAERVLSSRRAPVIVLSRHAGEGDSLLVLHELLVRHRRRPRVVLHEALRMEPLFDIFGHRLPNRFVDPRGGDVEGEIAALAAGLGAEDALLIFPEGGNFSAARRRRGIRRLERGGHLDEAAQARAMRHVSAPRPGGALAAVGAAPHADVVFVGHAGAPVGIGELWRTMAAGRTVQMRLWLVAADEIPEDHEERIEWLFGWWQALDTWVGEQSGATAVQPTPLGFTP
jgi:1-acyl-sn-glycerol-3-phosphate acyltransferase